MILETWSVGWRLYLQWSVLRRLIQCVISELYHIGSCFGCTLHWGINSSMPLINICSIKCHMCSQSWVRYQGVSRWDSIQWTHIITQKTMETCIFYTKKRLRIHRYHFGNPRCHLLMLWMAITPCILSLFYFGQCESCHASVFRRFTPHSSFFYLLPLSVPFPVNSL